MATAPVSVIAPALAIDPELEPVPESVTAQGLEIVPALETALESVTVRALVIALESETARQHFPACRGTNQETVPEFDLQSPAGRQRCVLRAFGHPEYAHRVFDRP